ncbi:MAG: hypothetical protein AB8B95_15605 [Pseudohongiellaceae bacterium]
MTVRYVLPTLFCLIILLPSAATAADRVGDFALLDHEGYFHQMSWYDDNKAVALLVYSHQDAAVEKAIPTFASLEKDFKQQGIAFFMIDPMGLKNRDAIKAHFAASQLSIPVLMDDARIISEALAINTTSEVILYNPKSFTISFRGPVGFEFEQALNDVAAGNEPRTAEVAAAGNPVSYPAKIAHQKQVPSYEKDIGPIIAENCAACHRAGGIAPFALDSHTMVMGWSQMIREVLMTKRMPPGQIDQHIGEFINDMVLADEDAQKIVHWIEAGSPKDGDSDPLAELVWPETEWAFGEPDYIIDIPEQSIPATGVLDYYNVMVDLDLEEDRWVRASQYIPGDHTVLHHTLHSLIQPGETQGGSLLGGDADRPNIAPYIPGQAPRMEPPNTGGLLKAGTRIAMQMHYTTTGKESVDASRIGLWFYPKGFIPEERMSGQCACHFTPTWVNIPPQDPDYEMTQSFTIEKDAKLFAFTPHMHFRGKRMRFFADYPDGTSEELINIAKYNYNWQLAYTYEEPKFVPAGTVITATGAFDNSEQNKMNPDPFRSVPWGLQSWDEMFFGAADWKYIDQSEL